MILSLITNILKSMVWFDIELYHPRVQLIVGADTEIHVDTCRGGQLSALRFADELEEDEGLWLYKSVHFGVGLVSLQGHPKLIPIKLDPIKLVAVACDADDGDAYACTGHAQVRETV